MKIFLAILLRDLRLAAGAGWQLPSTLLFFLLVIVLLAFGVGPDPTVLRTIAPGAVWVAALLAALLSLDRLFAADAEDGSLEQILVAPIQAELIALAKMTAHFLTTGLPLAIVSPLGALLLGLSLPATLAMVFSLLLGTPVLSLIGGAIAALLIGARRGGVLVALLALPLFIPALIFGAAAIEKALLGGSPTGPLTFLAALLALALPLCPIAAAAALED